MSTAKSTAKTLQQKLASRKIHKANFLIYNLLVHLIVKPFLMKNIKVNISYKTDPRKQKGPFIVVGNHASRLDYIYASAAFLPLSLNYVAGYNEFFRSHLRFIFRLMNAIPKRNFVSDFSTIKSIKHVMGEGGRVMLFTEGMSSISGTNQPSAVASGKFLKYFGLPVYILKIKGGYMVSTKYCLDERPGSVDVEVDLLFTPEELKSKSADELQDALDKAIAHDDYEWNKTARVPYDGHGEMAKNLHTLLYLCPRCGTEFSMRGEGNEIRCTHCGNGAELNEYYDLIPFDDDCVIPETPRIWYDEQRRRVREWVKNPDFSMREQVRIGMLPRFKPLQNQDTSEIVGAGELTLDHEGLHFEGEREGAPFSFTVRPENLPTYGMCTDVSRFYTFVDGEFIEFYPERETVAKWFLATEENHRYNGGQWKDFPESYHYYKENLR